MHRAYASLLLLCLLLLPLLCRGELIRIGFVIDGPSTSLQDIRNSFEHEIKDLLTPENEVQIRDFLGDWTDQGAHRVVDEAFASNSVSLVVGIGPIVSNDISLRKKLPKPSFAPYILDSQVQRLPYAAGTSGVRNLNYIAFTSHLERDISVFQQLKPFRHLAMLSNATVLRAVDTLEPGLVALGKRLKLDVQVVAIEDSVDQTLKVLPSNTEAVYLLPLPQITLQNVERLIDGLNCRGIPTFAFSSRSLVESGIMATLTPDLATKRLARRIALNIQRYLGGQPLETMPVVMTTEEQLILNMETASEVGVVPSWDLLIDADVVNENRSLPGPYLTLLDAVDEALSANSDLAAARQALAVGLQQVRKAAAPLLPQVQVGALARIIDRDRAIIALGTEPQAALFSTASASQVLYSNKLWGNLSIERRKQIARWEGFVSTHNETVFNVATAYFNMLRAKTLHDIQLSNLRLTRSNLKTARHRVAIGEARSTEVFRWESEVATNRTNAIRAQYQMRSAMVALNRLLNRDQCESISVEDISSDDPCWILNGIWFDHNLADTTGLDLLSEFELMEGLSLSPQMRQLRTLIEAQAEAVNVAKRSFYTPDINFAADVRERAAAGGAGQAPIVPLFPFNRTNFSVGVTVTYPLFTGGARIAEKEQAIDELLRLQCELSSVEQQLEQGIRTGLNSATASYAAIRLSRESAEAADKSRNQVADAYTEGNATVVDLLDAQNQALVAASVSANAEYDFLIDLVKLQSIVGRFDFLMTCDERDELAGRLNEYIVDNRKDSSCMCEQL